MSEGQSASDLLPQLYEELRKLAVHRMAGQQESHTLQATALVHEAYLRVAIIGSCRLIRQLLSQPLDQWTH